MDFVLKQKQTLTLTMTPELRQAIGLLQLSTYELFEYLQEQELDNPLIELEEQTNEHPYEVRVASQSASSGKTSSLDFLQQDGPGMREKLIQEADLLFENHDEKLLVRHILSHLDDHGYFSLSENDRIYNEEMLTKGIHLLQKLGTIGIGARDLQECLALQITYAHPEQHIAKTLIDEHLDLLAYRKWADIASLMNLPLSEVKEGFNFIQTLNPRPCAALNEVSAQYLYPDIIVDAKEGELTFHLNDRYLPIIHFRSDYINNATVNNEATTYIQSKHTHYKWLLNSIEQRRQTITKIMHVIVRKQAQFFIDGMTGLLPLTLKDVAAEIEMHESTVSRATMNKVVQTPKGCVELRIFFTTKLGSEEREDISQAKLKALLQDLVANENKQKPLSDQQIAHLFKSEHNIVISRRTISKYREELNIASSRMRKEI